MALRGVGTLYTGLIIMTVLVGLAVYTVHLGENSLYALQQQQQLQERVRYIALNANMTSESIVLPEQSDIVVVSDGSAPRIAVNTRSLSIPHGLDAKTVYIVKRGEPLRVGNHVFQPVAATRIDVGSRKLNSILNSNGNNFGGLCSISYQDPAIHSYFNNPLAYRSYIPAWSTVENGRVLFGVRGACYIFNRNNLGINNGNAVDWREALKTAGFTGTAIDRIERDFCKFFNTTLAKEIIINGWYYQPLHIVIRPPTREPTLIILGLAHQAYNYSYAYMVIIYSDGRYEYNYTIVPVSALDGWGHYKAKGSTSLSVNGVVAEFSWDILVNERWLYYMPSYFNRDSRNHEHLWGTIDFKGLKIEFDVLTLGAHNLGIGPGKVLYEGSYSFYMTLEQPKPVLWYIDAGLIADGGQQQLFNETRIGFTDGALHYILFPGIAFPEYGYYTITPYSNTARVISLLYAVGVVLYTPCDQPNVLP